MPLSVHEAGHDEFVDDPVGIPMMAPGSGSKRPFGIFGRLNEA